MPVFDMVKRHSNYGFALPLTLFGVDLVNSILKPQVSSNDVHSKVIILLLLIHCLIMLLLCIRFQSYSQVFIQIKKMIKLLQPPHPLGFNDNIHHEDIKQF